MVMVDDVPWIFVTAHERFQIFFGCAWEKKQKMSK